MITLTIKYLNSFNNKNINTYILNFLTKYQKDDAFFLYLNYRIFIKRFMEYYYINNISTWQYLKTTRLVLYCINHDDYQDEIENQFYLPVPFHTDPRWYIPLNWLTNDIIYMDNVYQQTQAADNILYSVFSIQKTILTKIIEQPDNDPYAAPSLALKLNAIPGATFVDLPNPTNITCANIWQALLYQADFPPGVALSFSQRVPIVPSIPTLARFNNFLPNNDVTISEHPLTVPFVEFTNTTTPSTYRGFTSNGMTNFRAYKIKYPIIGNKILKYINPEPLCLKKVEQEQIIDNYRFNGTQLVYDSNFFCVLDETYLFYENNAGGFAIDYGSINLANPDIQWTSCWHKSTQSGTYTNTQPIIGYSRYYNFEMQIRNEDLFILPNDIQAVAVYNRFTENNYYNENFYYSISKHQEPISIPLNNSNFYASQQNYRSDAANSISIIATTPITNPSVTYSPYTEAYYTNPINDQPYSWSLYVNPAVRRYPTYICQLETMQEGIRSIYIPDKFLCNIKFVAQKIILFKDIEVKTDINGLFIYKPFISVLNTNFDFNFISIRTYAFKPRPADNSNNVIKTDPFFNWAVSTPLAKQTVGSENEYPILNLSNTFENTSIFFPLATINNDNFIFYFKTNYKSINFTLNLQLIFTN